jgi:GT2 family glycosyltransferase
MKKITVLIPTYNRADALAVTLTSLCFQDQNDFDIIISDQSTNEEVYRNASLITASLLLEKKGHNVSVLKNLPRQGLAQQRQFLLEQAETPYVLFLDDDVILEPYVVKNLLKVMQEQETGFTGNAVIGLTYKNDIRPDQQNITFWEEKIQPERIEPGSEEWQRYRLHNAANPLHVQEKYKITPDNPVPYKIAWVGGCVLYDREKLNAAGGFSFWKDLPENHCGEDVLAQLRVMKRFGGCGVLPSGVYHQELETTVPDRKVNAPEVLEI